MPNIKSSADLRNNYNEISTFCHNYSEPVFITKNGKGDLVVMSIEAYEQLVGRFDLYGLIQEGLDEAESKINVLSTFPEKFALVDDAILSSWGIRFIIVKNYLAFYLIDEQIATVHIVRFLYGKSDWVSILKCGFQNYL